MKQQANDEKAPGKYLRRQFVTLSLLLILLLMITIFSSSCANNEPDKPNEKQIEVSEGSQNDETSTREALFVYGTRSKSEISLVFGGEPLLLSSSYARLVGVVCGGRPVACLEVGGKGAALSLGELVDGYRIIQIMNNKVVFKKDGK
ncbi:MAG: hypothetical protein WCV91_04460 [Candidatus Margulisiibacteriota bacterium]